MKLKLEEFYNWEKVVLKFSLAISVVLAIVGYVIGNTLSLVISDGITLHNVLRTAFESFIGFFTIGTLINFIAIVFGILKQK